MTLDPAIPRLDLLCRATVEVGAPLLVGPMPLGERRIIPIRAAVSRARAWAGTCCRRRRLADRAGGRSGGARGALLCAHRGRRARLRREQRPARRPPDVLARLARGEHVAPSEYYFRTTPRFETAAPRYAWLNSVVAVGSAVRSLGAVILDFYVVS